MADLHTSCNSYDVVLGESADHRIKSALYDWQQSCTSVYESTRGSPSKIAQQWQTQVKILQMSADLELGILWWYRSPKRSWKSHKLRKTIYIYIYVICMYSLKCVHKPSVSSWASHTCSRVPPRLLIPGWSHSMGLSSARNTVKLVSFPRVR